MPNSTFIGPHLGISDPKNTKNCEIFKLDIFKATPLFDFGESYVVYAWFPSVSVPIINEGFIGNKLR